jgi:hypothetical protein
MISVRNVSAELRVQFTPFPSGALGVVWRPNADIRANGFEDRAAIEPLYSAFGLGFSCIWCGFAAALPNAPKLLDGTSYQACNRSSLFSSAVSVDEL